MEFIWVEYIILSYNETSESYSQYSTYLLLSFPGRLQMRSPYTVAFYKLSANMLNMSRPITQSVRSTGHFPFHVEFVCVCACLCACFVKVNYNLLLSFILQDNINSPGYCMIDKEKNNRINPCLLMQCVNRKLKQFQNRRKGKDIEREIIPHFCYLSWQCQQKV